MEAFPFLGGFVGSFLMISLLIKASFTLIVKETPPCAFVTILPSALALLSTERGDKRHKRALNLFYFRRLKTECTADAPLCLPSCLLSQQ